MNVVETVLGRRRIGIFTQDCTADFDDLVDNARRTKPLVLPQDSRILLTRAFDPDEWRGSQHTVYALHYTVTGGPRFLCDKVEGALHLVEREPETMALHSIEACKPFYVAARRDGDLVDWLNDAITQDSTCEYVMWDRWVARNMLERGATAYIDAPAQEVCLELKTEHGIIAVRYELADLLRAVMS